MAVAERSPVGVVGLITGWNFPLVIPVRKIATALVAGNASVFKPALQTTGTGAPHARARCAAGMPAAVLNVVAGAADGSPSSSSARTQSSCSRTQISRLDGVRERGKPSRPRHACGVKSNVNESKDTGIAALDSFTEWKSSTSLGRTLRPEGCKLEEVRLSCPTPRSRAVTDATWSRGPQGTNGRLDLPRLRRSQLARITALGDRGDPPRSDAEAGSSSRTVARLGELPSGCRSQTPVRAREICERVPSIQDLGESHLIGCHIPQASSGFNTKHETHLPLEATTMRTARRSQCQRLEPRPSRQ